MPHKLATDANLDLAEDLTDRLVGRKPYELAVHNPVGSLANDRNLHMHLMFSDRVDDGIERGPEQTFKRYNAKHPERGGRRKDSGGKSRFQVHIDMVQTRKVIADCINEHLDRHGIKDRVDHRSLEDQGIAREPERHLGAARVRRMSPGERAAFAGLRANS